VVGVVTGGVIGCTAVLVHPRIALTAAHCVAPDPPSAIVVGADAATGASILVARARRHPEAAIDPIGSDIAYLVLATPADVAPATIGAIDASDLGGDARVVGFGRSAADDATPAVKRAGTSKIAAVEREAPVRRDLRPVRCIPSSRARWRSSLVIEPRGIGQNVVAWGLRRVALCVSRRSASHSHWHPTAPACRDAGASSTGRAPAA